MWAGGEVLVPSFSVACYRAEPSWPPWPRWGCCPQPSPPAPSWTQVFLSVMWVNPAPFIPTPTNTEYVLSETAGRVGA